MEQGVTIAYIVAGAATSAILSIMAMRLMYQKYYVQYCKKLHNANSVKFKSVDCNIESIKKLVEKILYKFPHPENVNVLEKMSMINHIELETNDHTPLREDIKSHNQRFKINIQKCPNS